MRANDTPSKLTDVDRERCTRLYSQHQRNETENNDNSSAEPKKKIVDEKIFPILILSESLDCRRVRQLAAGI